MEADVQLHRGFGHRVLRGRPGDDSEVEGEHRGVAERGGRLDESTALGFGESVVGHGQHVNVARAWDPVARGQRPMQHDARQPRAEHRLDTHGQLLRERRGQRGHPSSDDQGRVEWTEGALAHPTIMPAE